MSQNKVFKAIERNFEQYFLLKETIIRKKSKKSEKKILPIDADSYHQWVDKFNKKTHVLGELLKKKNENHYKFPRHFRDFWQSLNSNIAGDIKVMLCTTHIHKTI
jgi:hypothetical protein